jgi:MYXO-CTERM domain-containing protein
MSYQSGLWRWIPACLCALVVVSAAQPSDAVPVLLSDNNSTVSFETSTGAVTSWMVDGVEQVGTGIGQHYRIGAGVDEAPIGSLTLVGGPTVTLGRIGVVNYLDNVGTPDFTANMVYTLTGGAPGSGFSSLNINNTLTSVSATTLDFNFFELADLDLTNTPANDVANVSVSNFLVSAMQSDTQTVYHQDVISGGAALNAISGYEVGNAAALAARFSDGLATDLGTIGSAPTSDAAFALQYHFALGGVGNPNSASLVLEVSTISANQNVVPEPASALLALAGLGAAGLWSRRRTPR